MDRLDECRRQLRAALRSATSARNLAEPQCWLEIADERASLAAEWIQLPDPASQERGVAADLHDC